MERELSSGVDQRVLRWFGHVETMDEQRMATGGWWQKQVKASVGYTEVRFNGLGEGGNLMAMRAARQCANDMKQCAAQSFYSSRPGCLRMEA